MQKIINIVIVLALLLSGFSLYKVYALGSATTQAVAHLDTLQASSTDSMHMLDTSMAIFFCRIHQRDLVINADVLCKPIWDAQVTAAPQPAPATTTAP